MFSWGLKLKQFDLAYSNQITSSRKTWTMVHCLFIFYVRWSLLRFVQSYSHMLIILANLPCVTENGNKFFSDQIVASFLRILSETTMAQLIPHKEKWTVFLSYTHVNCDSFPFIVHQPLQYILMQCRSETELTKLVYFATVHKGCKIRTFLAQRVSTQLANKITI